MTPRLLLATLTLLLASAGAQHAATAPESRAAPARFTSVDVFVDPRAQALAAYQLEFVADPQRVMLVGIEGGEHSAFAEPPHYDPAALNRNRVIIAAFSTAAELPHERTRVATLHLRVEGAAEPTLSARLQVAGNTAGESIPADVSIVEGVNR